MFEQIPLELRQYIYMLHIDNCTHKVGDESVPYHNALVAFVPWKSALLFVNKRISEEFRETLSRHTRRALVRFCSFDEKVECDMAALSNMYQTRSTASIIVYEVREVNLIIETDFEPMPKVMNDILNGCFDILHRFKKLEQVRFWVISGYEGEEDADDEFDGGTTEGQKAELYVQMMIEGAKKLEGVKTFFTCWEFAVGEKRYSCQSRKDSQSGWKELDAYIKHPSISTFPWISWDFVYCQQCHAFRTEKERRGHISGCGHHSL